MTNFQYQLTEHAKKVIYERNIKLEWIEHTVSSPLKTELDASDIELEHVLAKIQEYDNRILRVIYNKTTKPFKIITVYFDRALKGKL